MGLFGLMLLGMAFETLGVGLVVPALLLMSRADLTARYPGLAPWLGELGNPSREQLVVAGMLALVAAYALKAAFLGFLTWRQMRFVYGLQAAISERLFTTYLRQPYTFHLQRNSAQLIRNAIGEVNILTQNGVLQALTFLTETLVIVGILVLLLYVEATGAVVAIGTLGLFGYLFYRLTRARTLRWGEARQLHDGMRIQHLQQGLGGVKEVKLLGRESEIIGQYGIHARGAADVGERQHTLTQLPRLALELLAVIALAVLVAVMVSQGKPIDELLPTLGLFAAAAFRVMPSANRIINAVQVVRHSLPVVDVLYDELRAPVTSVPAPRAEASQPFRSALVLDDVYFWYPNTTAAALAGVSLHVNCGETVGLIGESGAGKSTLVDVFLGLLTPGRGTICVDDRNIQDDLRAWQDNIGYVPQTVFLTDDTLRRNIAFGVADGDIDDAEVWRAAGLAQIERFIRELPEGLETQVGERGVRLSGGQLQRIGIARALYHNPDVLVLDEATSSLDTVTERGVMEAVRALHGQKTVIIVAHRLSTVEQCDRLYRLEAGHIVDEGSPARLLRALHA